LAEGPPPLAGADVVSTNVLVALSADATTVAGDKPEETGEGIKIYELWPLESVTVVVITGW
jgi:hypothetical protein